ncbi:hypothetical protein P3X46_004225 [Hevea brasiliensis]|uniref:4Fe-4S ferredoxin-type domain-containing protein n=1 Tax=Hevea brasiliensis TaxID=3981 RepID=A0ABQ9MZZ2_HEVBR|nr:hypothetical protein P3X46_004225 [Hevea brasiliensis]
MGDKEECGYDAIVVGSGYGGSVAACRMSLAGIKVCLIEKGRRWKAEDFPTDAMKIMAAVRMENQNLGISFGPKHALFQVYEQNDSLAAVACGLGGGSLVNAGVMMTTPVRARRNAKWPKEWDRDWDICEASAAVILRVQDSLLKLSMNFHVEDPPSNSMKLQQMSSCLACGNCIAGCPHDAKNSTDKNYILSVVQAGCTVRTECQVQYLTGNKHEVLQQERINRKRRWRTIYCNGNTVAYLAGSSAPLCGYGLDRKQMSKICFQDRPGPSISSSYTTSLGFTIQGWPTGYRFFHGIIDKLKRIIGLKSTQSIALNTEKICFTPPHDPLLPKKIEAYQKLTKKLGGILFISRYRSTAVHLLGGWNASLDSSAGVCNHKGQASICDASLIPCSVGINPCLTIATVAEHVSKHLVQDVLDYKSKRDRNFEILTVEQDPCLDADKNRLCEGEVDLCVVDHRTPYTQYIYYRLLLVASSGSKYILEGKKMMNPYLFALYAWKETTTLHVTFKKVAVNCTRETMVNLKGELRVSFLELLKSFLSLKGDNGHFISCRQWKCFQNPLGLKGEKQLNPVLLLNGHSTESYRLPTEPRDLIRTLLEEVHEIWLLQPRLHPMNPVNSFTIEDIGKYDIPATINMILELHGPSARIHVAAHCVGGLSIHIALMGGHVSATHIAYLSCTNSSMFFKLTTLARFKMWLPLVPARRKSCLCWKHQTSSRHRLLKFIACCIPRCERCTCKECKIFSGIFGSTFRHENVSPTLHQCLNEYCSTKLPMGAFPHLGRICNSGFIVDKNGNNSYLIHPERMAVSMLYISGGRTLLVTPETSFLANKYMKLHQPNFRHERVVVEGFGHSDLLIGEKSYEKVCPHILSHIRIAEQEGKGVMSSERKKKYSKEALYWGNDPYEDCIGFRSWLSPMAMAIVSLVLFLLLLFSLLM